MSNTKLSILIPTVHGRWSECYTLLEKIHQQIPFNKRKFQRLENTNGILKTYFGNDVDADECELIVFKDNKQITIGQKRQIMYKECDGAYAIQIDDDDAIADDAISQFIEAIKQSPDCITFKENCIMNGKYYSCNHSLKYDDWADNFDGYNFVRTPFYKDVIKTSIAKSVPFEHIRYGEDHAWSRALKPHLKTEVHIDKELYFYQHNSKPEDHNERYGINRDA